MTQEQKARAYDEALERAQKATRAGSDVAMDIVQYIFPQLAESEDEGIRKELIEFIKWSVDRHFMREDFHQAKRPSEWIAYLEKQKDASKAIEAVDRIDKYIDENTTNAHDMKDSHPDKKYCQGIDNTLSDIAGILQDVYSEKENKFAPRVLPCSAAWFEDGDEKQKEQKPILKFKVGDKVHLEGDDVNIVTITGIEEDRYLTDSTYYGPILFGVESLWQIVEQKPAEWSEEDEKNRRSLNTKEIKVGDTITYFRNGKKGIMLVSSFDSGIYPRCKWGITDIDGTAYGDWTPGSGPYYAATEKEKQQLYDTMPIEVKNWLKSLRP